MNLELHKSQFIENNLQTIIETDSAFGLKYYLSILTTRNGFTKEHYKEKYKQMLLQEQKKDNSDNYFVLYSDQLLDIYNLLLKRETPAVNCEKLMSSSIYIELKDSITIFYLLLRFNTKLRVEWLTPLFRNRYNNFSPDDILTIVNLLDRRGISEEKSHNIDKCTIQLINIVYELILYFKTYYTRYDNELNEIEKSIEKADRLQMYVKYIDTSSSTLHQDCDVIVNFINRQVIEVITNNANNETTTITETGEAYFKRLLLIK